MRRRGSNADPARVRAHRSIDPVAARRTRATGERRWRRCGLDRPHVGQGAAARRRHGDRRGLGAGAGRQSLMAEGVRVGSSQSVELDAGSHAISWLRVGCRATGRRLPLRAAARTGGPRVRRPSWSHRSASTPKLAYQVLDGGDALNGRIAWSCPGSAPGSIGRARAPGASGSIGTDDGDVGSSTRRLLRATMTAMRPPAASPPRRARRSLPSPALGLSRPTPIVVGFPQLPLSGIVIALDPGHNGGNAAHASQIATPVWIGTGWKPCNKVGTSTPSGYPEHAFTFDVASRAKAEPRGARGHSVPDAHDRHRRRAVHQRPRAVRGEGRRASRSASTATAPSSGHGFFVMKPGIVAGWTDDISASSGVLAVAMRDGLKSAGLLDRELLRDERSEDADRPGYAQLLGRAGRRDRDGQHEERRRRGPDVELEPGGSSTRTA